MDAKELWEITNKILFDHQEQLTKVFSSMGRELDEQLEARGVPLMDEEVGYCLDGKVRMVALSSLSSSLSIEAFLKMSWHNVLNEEEETNE